MKSTVFIATIIYYWGRFLLAHAQVDTSFGEKQLKTIQPNPYWNIFNSGYPERNDAFYQELIRQQEALQSLIIGTFPHFNPSVNRLILPATYPLKVGQFLGIQPTELYFTPNQFNTYLRTNDGGARTASDSKSLIGHKGKYNRAYSKELDERGIKSIGASSNSRQNQETEANKSESLLVPTSEEKSQSESAEKWKLDEQDLSFLLKNVRRSMKNADNDPKTDHETKTSDRHLKFDEKWIVDSLPLDEETEELKNVDSTSKEISGLKASYKKDEQNEFNTLLGRLTENTSNLTTSSLEKSSKIQQRIQPKVRPKEKLSGVTLSNQGGTTTSTPTPKSPATAFNRLPIQSESTLKPLISKTYFEKQASDFRSRLDGSNGFLDFLKILENANINLYERRLSNGI